METFNFLDDELKQFFEGEDRFNIAQSIDGKVFREYENRVTKQFQFQNKSYFIKFHGPVGWKEIFKNLIQIKVPVIGAKREYEALNHLYKNTIHCPQIKGFGKKGLNPSRESSFLITEELYETISLEDFFLKGLHKDLTRKERTNLIKAAASHIRKMHMSGLNHRDLYLCHLHIKKETDFHNVKIYLIDLHRAQIRSTVPERWIVKDIGGFLHSAIQFNLTERDFYRFMMTYYNCSFRDLVMRHSTILRKILDRAFSMYLKPSLKEFSNKSTSTASQNSSFMKLQKKSGRCFVKKSLELDHLIRFFEDEDFLISQGEVIKNEKGHLIVKVKILDSWLYIKKYRIKSLVHGMSRLLKKTRAYNSWLSTIWLNSVGIRTANLVSLYEADGFLGWRDSFLVTQAIDGKRLDEEIEQGSNADLIVSRITAFFKRMDWIRFTHGDAKTSNFFFNQKELIAFDLDSSRRRNLYFLHNIHRKKDKKRILRSLQNDKKVFVSLYKRLHGN